jgi:flagellar basal body-associated protein FliL
MSASRAQPVADAQRREGLRLFLIASAITAVIALPMGVAVGMSWVDIPWSPTPESQPAPDWVTLPQLRATTQDGSFVKARIALDVQGASARGTIQSRTQQVGLVLEVAVAGRTRDQIRAPDGMKRLSTDMRDRLNEYLESEGDKVVRSVAIQDLIVNPQ